MYIKQRTIARKISFQGFGLYYTKKKITVTINPAPIHTGFLFIRTDLKNKPCIRVHFSSLLEIEKNLILKKDKVKIYTTGHIIAALNGMNLDNIIIELNNVEVPILDGSSKLFVEEIEKVGIVEQNAERKYFFIKDFFSIKNEKTGGEIIISPSKRLEIITIIDFDSKNIDTQNALFKKENQFKEIADSKIFCVIHNKNRFSSLLKSNEIARHILLDIIGILALLNVKLKCRIIIYNPDKSIIIKLLDKLIEKINVSKINKIKYVEKKIIFDTKSIMNILPHKSPFLLIDKVIDLSKDYIVGVKNVTINEPFFKGHFPNEPIMPGVLQIEAIAQAGGILILSKFNDPKLYSTYLIKIDKVKFLQKIVPGDIIILQVHLLKWMKRGLLCMKGYGYVNEKLVVEAEIMAKITKK